MAKTGTIIALGALAYLALKSQSTRAAGSSSPFGGPASMGGLSDSFGDIQTSEAFLEQGQRALEDAQITETEVVNIIQGSTETGGPDIILSSAGITPEEIVMINKVLPESLGPTPAGAVDRLEYFSSGGRVYETTIRAHTSPTDPTTGLTAFEKAQALAGATNIGSGPGSGDVARAILSGSAGGAVAKSSGTSYIGSSSSGLSRTQKFSAARKSRANAKKKAARAARAARY